MLRAGNRKIRSNPRKYTDFGWISSDGERFPPQHRPKSLFSSLFRGLVGGRMFYRGRWNGKPHQNAYVERYNRTVRHEWLDLPIFETIDEVWRSQPTGYGTMSAPTQTLAALRRPETEDGGQKSNSAPRLKDEDRRSRGKENACS